MRIDLRLKHRYWSLIFIAYSDASHQDPHIYIYCRPTVCLSIIGYGTNLIIIAIVEKLSAEFTTWFWGLVGKEVGSSRFYGSTASNMQL